MRMSTASNWSNSINDGGRRYLRLVGGAAPTAPPPDVVPVPAVPVLPGVPPPPVSGVPPEPPLPPEPTVPPEPSEPPPAGGWPPPAGAVPPVPSAGVEPVVPPGGVPPVGVETPPPPEESRPVAGGGGQVGVVAGVAGVDVVVGGVMDRNGRDQQRHTDATGPSRRDVVAYGRVLSGGADLDRARGDDRGDGETGDRLGGDRSDPR